MRCNPLRTSLTWFLALSLVVVLGTTPRLYAYGACQQTEKADQDKPGSSQAQASSLGKNGSEPKDGSGSEVRASEPSAAKAQGNVGSGYPAPAKFADSLSEPPKTDFKLASPNWNAWSPTSARQSKTDQTTPPSFSLYFMSEYRRDEIKYTGKPSLALQFPSPVPPWQFTASSHSCVAEPGEWFP